MLRRQCVVGVVLCVLLLSADAIHVSNHSRLQKNDQVFKTLSGIFRLGAQTLLQEDLKVKVGSLELDVYYALLTGAALVAAATIAVCLAFPLIWGKISPEKKRPSGLVSVEIGPESNVHDGAITHMTVAVIHFTIIPPEKAEMSMVEVSLDDQMWTPTGSPFESSVLEIGEHSASFRVVNEKHEPIGVMERVTWTVLPEDIHMAMGKGWARDFKNNKFVKLLHRTIEQFRPLVSEVKILADPAPPSGEHLLPSSLAPLPPINIPIQFAHTEEQHPLPEVGPASAEPKPMVHDPALDGPFTDKQLIDMTPNQLRQALLQNYPEVHPEDTKEMNPDDIRDFLRFHSPEYQSVQVASNSTTPAQPVSTRQN